MGEKRVMPDQVNLGQSFAGPMMSATRFRDNHHDRFPNPKGLRTVMGMLLPEWQRPFVWSEDQCVRLLESVWRGIPIGTYTINMCYGSGFDGYLIDGQQRMRAIEMYLEDAFPVFGYRWSEVTAVDRRLFDVTPFPYYETRSKDEAYLKSYYNLMNFGGVAHSEDQRAS